MKIALLVFFLLIFELKSWGGSPYDSLIIYPKPAKNCINITKIGNDTIKFNIFLFRNDGHLVKSSINTNQLYVNDIMDGSYVLEIYEEINRYRYNIKIEN